MRTTPLVFPTLVVTLAAGCTSTPAADLEANKALVRQFNDAALAQDWDALSAVVADDFTRHSAATPDVVVTSREALIELQRAFAASVPDQRVTMHQLVAEGDFVAVRATYSGTQTGPMGEIPATGLPFESPFLGMFRIVDGRIAELWVEWDNVYMLTQLGLFPPSGPANR